MTIIDQPLFKQLHQQAKASPRLRMNYNLHDSLDDKVQRLLNALEPGTIIPIHRHQHTDETYILLEGTMNLIFFNDDKTVKYTQLLSVASGCVGINIPSGQWHTIDVLEPSVIFEVKEGPYQPLKTDDQL
ncbi:MAG: WbuC family cupin fold metalloprotein [Bacteroidales bacterium]|nr:WbuC family cupin fold metalloprotein [Bacteroidales bacterium]